MGKPNKKMPSAIKKWQTAHIKEGLRQAVAGKFAKDSEVDAAFRRWRKNENEK